MANETSTGCHRSYHGFSVKAASQRNGHHLAKGFSLRYENEENDKYP